MTQGSIAEPCVSFFLPPHPAQLFRFVLYSACAIIPMPDFGGHPLADAQLEPVTAVIFMEDMAFLLQKVRAELERFEHLLFEFWCAPSREGVALNIRLKWPEVYDGIYTLELKERDIMDTQFPWSFQRLLFACIHDYAIEMFTRTPQSRV